MRIAKFVIEGRSALSIEDLLKNLKAHIENLSEAICDVLCEEGDDFPSCYGDGDGGNDEEDGDCCCSKIDSCKPYKIIMELHDANS